jgi:hypothetical protein
MKRTIALEFDDFNPLNHRFDVLEKLKLRYPNLKVTMFTVCWDLRYQLEKGGLPISKEDFIPWVNAVKHAVKEGWLEIAIHGLTHVPHEFLELEPKLAASKVKFAEKFLKQTKIPYVKIFKPPYWEIRADAKKEIEKAGFSVVEDGYYNWNIKDSFPVELDQVIGHGHVQDTMGNGIEEALINLMQIPEDYEWKFISEVL